MNKFNREELVQTLFEESGDALFLFDPASEQVVDVNPAVQRLTGFTRQELLRMAVAYLFRSEIQGRLHSLRNAFRKTGAFHSQEGFLLRTKEDGVWIPLNLSVTRLHVRPAPLGLITARDIREQRKAHDRLAKMEAELRRVLASVSDCVWSQEIDPSGRIRSSYASPVVTRLTGRPPEFYDQGPEAWLTNVHHEDRPRLRDGLQLLQEREVSASEYEYRVVWPDQSVRWLRNSIKATRDADGKVRLDGVATDITERKRGEEAVLASEARYRSLTENLEQCVFLKDEASRFVAANRRFCEVLGRTEAEVLGKTDQDFYPSELATKYQADDRRILAEGKVVELEEQNLMNGQMRTVRVVKTPVKDAHGRHTGVLCIFWDVTEQRTLEAQLQQAQKMEAVGQLAGGVAHDFNNLLTIILGNVALLRSEDRITVNPLTQTECKLDRTQLLNDTEKAAVQAAALTSKLLGFSRRTALHLEQANLTQCAEEAISLLRRTIDPRITLKLRGAPDLWRVRADRAQINQVLMNLCLNARDAMPEGGRLLLETANVVLDAEYTRLHMEAQQGEFVRLRVEDTGHGIPPEVRQRIFEPFFTTKAPGKGTGLGLAMVFGIVKQHGGWINCYSEVGAGTRFDIYLPRSPVVQEVQPSGPVAAENGSANPSPSRGRETILLADDEPLIRQLGRTILESYGYQVRDAEDGRQAVDMYREAPDAIDLVILDLTMPRLSGRDAFRQLVQLNPDVRILFASGYSAEHISETESERVLGFVGKPYHPRQLVQSVRAALDWQPCGEVGRSPL
jgi:PAS domain S-box-containing protein